MANQLTAKAEVQERRREDVANYCQQPKEKPRQHITEGHGFGM